MNRSLHHEIMAPAMLSTSQRDAMFVLFERCYDCVSRSNFEADLRDKSSVILLRDAAGILRGFSTQKAFDCVFKSETVRILFSGDTIVDPDCWGSPELMKGWCRVAAKEAVENAGKRLFWFLISKGFRTYLFLPVFFKKFLPSFSSDASSDWNDLLNEIAGNEFGTAWNRAAGLIQFEASRGQLTDELARVSDGKLADPHVQYFLHSNPDYQQGVELACLAEISIENTHGLGRRWLQRAMEQELEAHEKQGTHQE